MSDNDDAPRTDEQPPKFTYEADSEKRRAVRLREDDLVVISNLLLGPAMRGPEPEKFGSARRRQSLANRLASEFYREDGDEDDVELLNGQSDTYILEQAIETVYERPDQHGEPEDSFGTIAQMWNGYIEASSGPLDAADVANLMVLLKVARNAEGHYHDDNYVDIAGYAENAARLEDLR